MAANQQQPWRGVEIHGFASEQELRESIAGAGRYLLKQEICAMLMNAQRFALRLEPFDTEPRPDFVFFIVSEYLYHEMITTAGATEHQGWLGYRKVPGTRAIERLTWALKINPVTLLPRWEVCGAARLRRRVRLPIHLIPDGEEVYFFIQYCRYPLMPRAQKALVMLAVRGGRGGCIGRRVGGGPGLATAEEDEGEEGLQAHQQEEEVEGVQVVEQQEGVQAHQQEEEVEGVQAQEEEGEEGAPPQEGGGLGDEGSDNGEGN
ncbi:hypothetical protein ACP4OV_019371 [Aristida adscensionis]